MRDVGGEIAIIARQNGRPPDKKRGECERIGEARGPEAPHEQADERESGERAKDRDGGDARTFGQRQLKPQREAAPYRGAKANDEQKDDDNSPRDAAEPGGLHRADFCWLGAKLLDPCR